MTHSRILRVATSFVAALLMAFSNIVAQQNSGTAVASGSVSAVPHLVNYSGTLRDAAGRPITEVTGVTFLLYPEQRATTMGKGLTVINVCTSDVPVNSQCTALTSSQVLAWTQDTGGSSNNSYFHLIVY